eukprot:gene46074-41431_t
MVCRAAVPFALLRCAAESRGIAQFGAPHSSVMCYAVLAASGWGQRTWVVPESRREAERAAWAHALSRA